MDTNTANSSQRYESNAPNMNTSAPGNSSINYNAGSRDLLTRGFNTFDDANLSGYMIDEKELLDLEHINSDLAGLGSYNSGPVQANQAPAYDQSAGGPVNGGEYNQRHMGHQVRPTGVKPTLAGQAGLPFGTTPPIPHSTSPFDEFMLSKNNARPSGSTSTQQAMWSERHKRAQAANNSSSNNNNNVYSPNQVPRQGTDQIFSPPLPSDNIRSPPQLPMRFLHDYGVHSNTSSPVGSLGSDAFGLSPSAKPPLGKAGGMAHSLDDKQQQILAERRRRRRESHNAVERRRRDNINEKIQELATLVPDSLLYAADPLASPTGPGSQASNLTKDGKPNKGTILSRSVDYIRNLQAVIDEQNRKELEMRDLVQDMQRQLGVEVTNFGPTSAEIALARIRGIAAELDGIDEGILEGYADDGVHHGMLASDLPSPNGGQYPTAQGYDLYSP